METLECGNCQVSYNLDNLRSLINFRSRDLITLNRARSGGYDLDGDMIILLFSASIKENAICLTNISGIGTNVATDIFVPDSCIKLMPGSSIASDATLPFILNVEIFFDIIKKIRDVTRINIIRINP